MQTRCVQFMCEYILGVIALMSIMYVAECGSQLNEINTLMVLNTRIITVMQSLIIARTGVC